MGRSSIGKSHYVVRPLELRDVPHCEEVLRALPAWFGIEQSIVDYVQDLATMPGVVAAKGETVLGFLALRHHNAAASEIHVMGVRQEYYRRGIGRALVPRPKRKCNGTADRCFR